MIETKIESNWKIRSAAVEDIDRIANFNTQIFRPSVGVWARNILAGLHPEVTTSDFVLIEDKNTGALAASLALIPQTWLFEDIPIRVGQVEFVGTADEYRGRGLASIGMKWFEREAGKKGCLLECVQGIPTFYQKLGYHFAVDLKGGVRLGIDQGPFFKSDPQFRIDPLGESDYTAAIALHNGALNFLRIRAEMTLPLWQYQEQQSKESEHAYETFGLKSKGILAGYLRFRRFSRLDALVLRECGFASYPSAVHGLAWAIELARSRGFSSVALQLPLGHPLARLAQTWGAQTIPPYAWQVHVSDWSVLINAIKPALERRLAKSLLNDWTGELIIHLADDNINWRFQFESGRVASVGRDTSPAKWHLKLTRPLMTALVFGFRSRANLEAVNLEAQSEPNARYLTDVLFPEAESYVYEAY